MARGNLTQSAVLASLACLCSAQWTMLGSVATKNAYGFEIVGPYAYLGDGGGGLRILDVSNPSSMSQVSQVPATFLANGRNVAITNDPDIIIVTMYHDGIWKVNVSDVAHPVVLGKYVTPSFAEMSYAIGNYVLVACDVSGLLVIDWTTMTLSTSLLLGHRARLIDVVGSYAYVADGNAGLQVVDISNVLAPFVVATLATPMFALGVRVRSNIAWVTMSPHSVYLIDVSSPTVPSVVTTIVTGTVSVSPRFDGNNAYLPAWEDGFSSNIGPSYISTSHFGTSNICPSYFSTSNICPSYISTSYFGTSNICPSYISTSYFGTSNICPSYFSTSNICPSYFSTSNTCPSHFGASNIGPSYFSAAHTCTCHSCAFYCSTDAEHCQKLSNKASWIEH
ncbi:hypothetical protein DIPPA_15962 [Diplonema papillatum]|nr:hypothetical protein DIPPA_21253 [Diplonema papillatum]KAJ9464374.1 hypothetical protein DIPPA_15962 [Diplonema papillatum]